MISSHDEEAKTFDSIPAEVKYSILFRHLTSRDVNAVLTTNRLNYGLKSKPGFWIAKIVHEMEGNVPVGVAPRTFYDLRTERTNVVTYLVALHCKHYLELEFSKSEEVTKTPEFKAGGCFVDSLTLGHADEILAAANKLIEACSHKIDVRAEFVRLYRFYDLVVLENSREAWQLIATLVRDDTNAHAISVEASKNIQLVIDLISAIGMFGAEKSLRTFNLKIANAPGIVIPDAVNLNIMEHAILFGQQNVMEMMLQSGVSVNAVCYRRPTDDASIQLPLIAIALKGLRRHARCAAVIDLTNRQDGGEEVKVVRQLKVFTNLITSLLQHGADVDQEFKEMPDALVTEFLGLHEHHDEYNPETTSPRMQAEKFIESLQQYFHLSIRERSLLIDAVELISGAAPVQTLQMTTSRR